MRRRISVTVLAGAAMLMAAGCGGENEASPSVTGETAASRMSNSAEPGAAEMNLSLGCDGPFTPEATPATLASVFGRENVIPETVDGPEGTQINVTAIYPKDPARRVEVMFRNEEERTGLMSVLISSPNSLWTGPGGLRMGDGVDAVEKINGGPFQIAGFQWDYGGFVTDWSNGKLGDVGECLVQARLSPEGENVAPEITGDGVQPLSSDAAVRSARPRVTQIGISWAR
jgi:hypothetical protein